jgi:UTP--glucose-1-phosphate uridylyltransferase
MLPLVDKPLIQYAVEEAVASGIEDIIIITGRGKRAIEDHFDRSVELEENLKGNGKAQLLSQMRHISTLANFCYVRQSEALGLGHAVLCAQRLIGDEPFAVILGDEIIDAPVAGLAQLIHAYKKRHGAILGVQERLEPFHQGSIESRALLRSRRRPKPHPTWQLSVATSCRRKFSPS